MKNIKVPPGSIGATLAARKEAEIAERMAGLDDAPQPETLPYGGQERASVNAPGWTQGEWNVGELDRNEQRQVVSDSGRLIAVCPHECVGALIPEMEANATLIASAPSLYEALDMAEATIMRLERHARGSANGTLDVVRAALAKARGGGA